MYQRSDLKNRLRVVTHDIPDRESVALGFWVGVGGRYETDRLKGAAHFLEHIVFKGSQKYLCNEIKELIEGVGGTLNAFTSEEQTCYYAKIPTKHLPRTFDILADMVFFPTIASKDVAKEKTVIVEEIKMYHDLPQFLVSEFLDELLWPNHPLGKKLTGTPETVSAMSAQDLRQFFGDYYSPSNVVVSACGNIRHQALVDLVERKLKKVPSRETRPYLKANHSQLQPRSKIFYKQTEQMHLALGMLGYDEYNQKRYLLSLLSIVLGGNMSSRLFNEVREKRGLAYSIASSSKSMHDTGMFLVRAGVDNHKIVEAIELVLKELNKVKRNGVTKGEFTRAQDYLIGQMVLALEDTMDHMLWIGESTIAKDKVLSLQEVIKIIQKIKRQDVVTIAREILDPKKFNLAVVGPVTSSQKKDIHSLLGGG